MPQRIDLSATRKHAPYVTRLNRQMNRATRPVDVRTPIHAHLVMMVVQRLPVGTPAPLPRPINVKLMIDPQNGKTGICKVLEETTCCTHSAAF
jgi:hypothetical protein